MHPHKPNIGRIPVAVVEYLTTTGAQNWTAPGSVSEVEMVDCYGPGYFNGGGCFARGLKVPVTPGGSIPYYIGAGDTNNATWFKTSSTVKAAPGGGGTAGCIGDIKYAGGAPGIGGGGGGAAGPDGAGLQGTSGNGGAPNAGVGGGAGGNYGASPTPGTASVVYGAGTPGPGGGGGASDGTTGGGAGANYGGAGGGAPDPEPSGLSGQGFIRLAYYV